MSGTPTVMGSGVPAGPDAHDGVRAEDGAPPGAAVGDEEGAVDALAQPEPEDDDDDSIITTSGGGSTAPTALQPRLPAKSSTKSVIWSSPLLV